MKKLITDNPNLLYTFLMITIISLFSMTNSYIAIKLYEKFKLVEKIIALDDYNSNRNSVVTFAHKSYKHKAKHSDILLQKVPDILNDDITSNHSNDIKDNIKESDVSVNHFSTIPIVKSTAELITVNSHDSLNYWNNAFKKQQGSQKELVKEKDLN